MKYWFYIEPYTFLFREGEKKVLYETTLAKEEALKQFVCRVRDTFSGDCVKCEDTQTTPFLFKPMLFLNSDIRTKEEGNKESLGEHVIQNLSEVTLYASAICTQGCKHCKNYFRQMNHCTCSPQGTLQREDYERILQLFQIIGIQRVNFIAGGDPIYHEDCLHYLHAFADSNFKKHLCLDYTFFRESYLKLSSKTHTFLDISVHSENWNNRLMKDMKIETDVPICWHFIVSDEAEMKKLNTESIPENAHFQIHPFYTGKNIDFFRQYVFIDMENWTEEPVCLNAIYRHKVLNDNFFGKLSIVPSGDVYANVNYPPIGNIKEVSLKELVYREVTKQQAWLTTRHDVEPCRHCINKDLCPSLSNYELVTGRNNLCHIHPTNK